MKNIIVLLISIISCSVLYGQEISPALQVLIQSEINFSNQAGKTNLKDAFNQYMLPDAVTFHQGKIEKWSDAQKNWPDGPEEGKVIWYPVYADMATSGDLGFTTGPLKVYAQKTDTVPQNVIVYNTVWKKQANGQWRAIADLGASKYDPKNIPLTVSTSKLKAPVQKKVNTAKAIEAQRETESKYNAELNGTKRSFAVSYLSDECRLHHPRNTPAIGKDGANNLVETGLEYSDFKVNDSGISASGDLAYSYGTLTLNIKGDKPRTLNVCYLRVWKKEDGKNWKLVLDVIA